MHTGDICIIVTVTDRRGRLTPRAVPTGYGAHLPGEGDTDLWTCAECGELVWFDERRDGQVGPLQDHCARDHGHTPALLPR